MCLIDVVTLVVVQVTNGGLVRSSLLALQNVQFAQVEAFHRKAKLLRGLGNRFKALAPVLGVLGLMPQLHVALCQVRCRRCERLAPC